MHRLAAVLLAAASVARAGDDLHLPDFELAGPDGTRVALTRDGDGLVTLAVGEAASSPRALLVHFFQPDCNACEAQMRALESLREDLAKENIALLGVAHRCGEDAVRGAAERTGARYPLLLGAGSPLCAAHARGDATVLADRRGRVRRKQVGFRKGDEELFAADLRRLAAGKELAAREGREALAEGDPMPDVRLPALADGTPMSLAVEDGKLAFRREGAEPVAARAAVGFFSRY